MANMRAIRNRIKSIETTRQIARSMRMVAASKLRRTQENWQKLAYFTAVSRDTLQKLCASADIQRQPLLARREGKRLCLVLIVGSRGAEGSGTEQYEVTVTPVGTNKIVETPDAFYVISVKSVKSPAVDAKKKAALRREMEQMSIYQIQADYNKFLQRKYPIKINSKVYNRYIEK